MRQVKVLLVLMSFSALLFGCGMPDSHPLPSAAPTPVMQSAADAPQSEAAVPSPEAHLAMRPAQSGGSTASSALAVEQTAAYGQLPEIIVGVDATLVASTSHPTSYVPSGRVLAGDQVRLVGTDENGAWLLVLHGNTLGWMPAFYSRNNIGTLKPVMIAASFPDACIQYLGAVVSSDDAWVSTIEGSVIVQGITYRPQPGKLERESATLEIEGEERASASDSTHIPLPGSAELFVFRFNVDDMQKGSHVRVRFAAFAEEPVASQVIFLSNDCPAGSERAIGGEPGSAAAIASEGPTATPVVITKESGPNTGPTATASTNTADGNTEQSSSAISANGLRVGESHTWNNLQFRLERVEVSVTEINTIFSVRNTGSAAVSFDSGPEMGYFLLMDNKGRAWPPANVPSGKVMLNPDSVSGDLGPRFDGKLFKDPEVTELTLTVQGILGNDPLTWKIPVNTLIPQVGDTASDAVLEPGEFRNYQGLELRMDRFEVSSDSVNTKLYVRNSTDGPLVFDARYDGGVFRLVDNLGQSYAPTSGQDGLIALDIGQESGDIGPRFDGSSLTESGVNQLIFSVSGLLGVPETRWVYQLNVQPANPTLKNTAPGAVLTVGQPWNHNDLILRLDRVEQGSTDLNTKFYVTNKTSSLFVFAFGPSLGYFTMVDNKGREWPVKHMAEGRIALASQATTGDLGPLFDGTYLSDPEVVYVVFTVKELLGLQEARWKIDIIR